LDFRPLPPSNGSARPPDGLSSLNGGFSRAWGRFPDTLGMGGGGKPLGPKAEEIPCSTYRRSPGRLSLAGCVPAKPAPVSPTGHIVLFVSIIVKRLGEPISGRDFLLLPTGLAGLSFGGGPKSKVQSPKSTARGPQAGRRTVAGVKRPARWCHHPANE